MDQGMKIGEGIRGAYLVLNWCSFDVDFVKVKVLIWCSFGAHLMLIL